MLILGVAYKKNIGDLRESPALDIIRLLQEKGALVKAITTRTFRRSRTTAILRSRSFRCGAFRSLTSCCNRLTWP